MSSASLGEQLAVILSGLKDLSVPIPGFDYDLPVMDVMFAILINYSYRSALGESHARIGWGQGLLATIVMCAGGGSTVSILRGEPLGIFKSNEFWAIHGAVYWLMNSSPYVYQLTDALFNLPMVSNLFTLSNGVLRNAAICQLGVNGVSTNPSLGPDKWVAQIICGTLAGCGGALWIDAFRLTQQNWSFSTPRLLHVASHDMKASFVSTLFYVATTNPALSPYLGIKPMNHEESQAWSAVLLTSWFVYGSYANKWQQSNEKKIEEKEA